ncbi:MAG: hypothetical protein R3E77_15185 [Steroidobacteraceae bacterium]
MKSFVSAAALGVLACAATLPAMAYPAGTAIPANRLFYISGASAQDQGIEFVMRKICTGNLDKFQFGNNDRFWSCDVTTASSGLTAGIAGFYKFSSGGSGNGVNPLIDNSQLTFTRESATSVCTNAAMPVIAGFTNGTDHTGCTNPSTSNVIPQIGFSDVEPKLITTPARAGALVANGANQLVFGIPVSLNLYRELQANQGLVADDEYINMPTLSSTTVASLFTGSIIDWSQLANNAGASLAAGSVKICRRVNTSGSQATTEVHFLRNRCTTSANNTKPMLPNDAAGTGTADPTFNLGNVYAGSGSGDVRDCLAVANDNGFRAVGLLSMECQPENASCNIASTVGKFRFVKIDGAAPTLVDTVSGRYSYVAEQSINRAGGLSGDPLTLYNKLLALMSDPAVLAQINAGFRFTFGDSGLLGVPDGATLFAPLPPLTEAVVRATPINSWNKNSLGTGTNNCQVSGQVNGAIVVNDDSPILPQG